MDKKLPHNPHRKHNSPGSDDLPEAGILGKAASGAFNTIMILPFAAPVVGFVGKAFGWTGEKTGINAIAKAGRSTQHAIESLSQKTIVELSSGRGYTKSIGDAIQKGADAAGNFTDKLSDSLHLERIGKASEYNAKKHLAKISELLGEHKQIPRELKPHLKNINNIVKNRSANFDPKKLESAVAGLSQAIKGLKKDLPYKVSKTLGTISKLSDKATNSKINATILSDLGGAVRGMPKALGNASAMNIIMNTGFVASSAMGVYGAAKGFKENLASLKEMAADIDGKPVSTFSLLFGKASGPVKEARSKLLKSFAASEISEGIGLGVSVANILKGRMSMLGFMAPQLAGIGASTLIGESVLPYYASLKQAHSSGRDIPVEAYAEFITKVSPELQARGHTGKVFSKKLAEQFAAEKTSPAEIMRESMDGNLIKRVNGIIASNEIAKPKKAIEITSINEPSNTHVAGLQKSANKVIPHKNQPVLGDHTAKVVSDAAQAQRALLT